MRLHLTQAAIAKLPAVSADIWDTEYPGLVLRTRPSGRHTYRVRFGSGRWFSLGRADVLTPVAARGRARDVLTDAAHGKDPMAERRKRRGATLETYLTQQYAPWALEHQKCGQETIDRLRACFGAEFGAKQLSEITAFAVERWRSRRLKAGVEPATVNRDLQTLKPALAKALTWGLIDKHPLAAVKPQQVDRIGTLRFLSDAEEKRLRAALTDREREVLQLLAEGKTTKWIASELSISVKTVETHRRNIMEKLDLHSIAELTKYAVREGVSPLDV